MKREHGRGLSLDKASWVALARSALLEVFDQQLIMPHAELEARLWEHGWHTPTAPKPLRFFPHILSEATLQLQHEGKIVRADHPTKGGITADLLLTGDISNRKTRIMQAGRRKGMLYARYLRWSSSFGDAGERVLNHSLTEAMREGAGYSPIVGGQPFGQITKIGELKFPGALDSGAWLLVRDSITGLPLNPHLVLIEVKNRRMTLYPRHPEIYQLLHKAALTAQRFPDQPIVPALICRHAHPWLYWMAKDLGFLALGSRRQFLTLPPKTDTKLLQEVKTELGLSDLTSINGTRLPRHVDFFMKTLPEQGASAARRWQLTAPVVLSWAEKLRKENHAEHRRTELLKQFYAEIYDLFDKNGLNEPMPWTVLPGEPE